MFVYLFCGSLSNSQMTMKIWSGNFSSKETGINTDLDNFVKCRWITLVQFAGWMITLLESLHKIFPAVNQSSKFLKAEGMK